MEAAKSWAELGQPDTAVTIFRDSLAAWPEQAQNRDRGLCLARLATAAAVQGDAQQACQAATEALVVARSTGSARIQAELSATYTRLEPLSSDSVVRDVRHRLASITWGE
jgi:hypothetical protein